MHPVLHYVAPPPAGFTAELLAEAVRLAAATVAVPFPPVEEGPVRLARWGDQLDVRNVTKDGAELSAEAVAAYIAKYATKSTEAFAGLDRRIHHDDDLDHLKVVPHLARLVRVCWELGAHPALAGLRLRAWAHALGFRGHCPPEVAATPPPSPLCAARVWCMRFAGGCAVANRWMPGVAARPRRPRLCLVPGASWAAATATTTAHSWR
jgi:hypothetical protein